jgi:hypothetical protein
LILFLFANNEGEDTIFSSRGSIFLSFLDFVLLIVGNIVATVSFGMIFESDFEFKKGSLGEQPAPPIKIKSNNKRVNKLNSPRITSIR